MDGPLDFFIAYAAPDRATADRLYELLSPRATVFLDHQSLRLGDDWDIELPAAQRRAWITVVLVSAHTGRGFYQREEIAAAIDLARRGSHRVVPLWLIDESDRGEVPYGLRIKHGAGVRTDTELAAAAEKLLALRDGSGQPGTIEPQQISPDHGRGLALQLDDPTPDADWRAGAVRTGTVTHSGLYSETIWDIAFSADGRRMATANFNHKSAWAWQLPDGRQLARVKHRRRVTCVALKGNGDLMASASDKGSVKISRLDGTEVAAMQCPDGVGALGFLPDGRLAVAGEDGTLAVWEAPPLRRTLLLELPHRGNLNTALDAGAHPDRLATGSFRTAIVWDLKTGQALLHAEATGSIKAVRLCRGGELLIAAGGGPSVTSESGAVHGWDVSSGRETITWDLDDQGWLAGASISGDGRWLATARYNRQTARVWDLKTGRAVAYLDHPGTVHSLAFSPDARLLAVDSGTKSVYLWAPKSGS